MGWIKRMRLKNALFAMMFFGLLLASLLSIGAFIGCTRFSQSLPQITALIEINSDPSVTIVHPEPSAPPAWSQAVGSLLGILQIALPILIFTLVILLTSILFYRTKLKEPLHILKSSTERIMQDDLDFVIPTPSGQDELGQLCGAFEKMREALLANNQTLWRQAEERKRLNAAFAHDLRNPVTVLKGTAKLLRKGIYDEQTIGRLEDYTLRIEQYIESMSSIQRLEQVPVQKKMVACDLLYRELEDTTRLLAPGLSCRVTMHGIGAGGTKAAEIDAAGIDTSVIGTAAAGNVAAEKATVETAVAGNAAIETAVAGNVAIETAVADAAVAIDHGLFMTVAENLIANGSRFAERELMIGLEMADSFLLLSVMDDGPGFSDELLQNGPKPFGRGKEYTTYSGKAAEDTACSGKAAEDTACSRTTGDGTGHSEISISDPAASCGELNPERLNNTGHFGMGLYSCQTICLKHGGKLTLENIEGSGAKATAFFKIL